jgi:hypothetical protein
MRFLMKLHHIRSTFQAAQMLRKFITRRKLCARRQTASISAGLDRFGCHQTPRIGVPLIVLSDPRPRPWQRTLSKDQADLSHQAAGQTDWLRTRRGDTPLEFRKMCMDMILPDFAVMQRSDMQESSKASEPSTPITHS